MRYKVKSIAALDVILDGLQTRCGSRWIHRVREDCWPTSEGDNLARQSAITTPQERHPQSAVKVSKANVASRVTPKP
jgi:hypothetical protein